MSRRLSSDSPIDTKSEYPLRCGRPEFRSGGLLAERPWPAARKRVRRCNPLRAEATARLGRFGASVINENKVCGT